MQLRIKVLPVPREDLGKAVPVDGKCLSSFLFFLCEMRLCRSQPQESLPDNPGAYKLMCVEACPQSHPQGTELSLLKRFSYPHVVELAKPGELYGDAALCSPSPKRSSDIPRCDPQVP